MAVRDVPGTPTIVAAVAAAGCAGSGTATGSIDGAKHTPDQAVRLASRDSFSAFDRTDLL